MGSAEGCGKPSHNSWQELSFIAPIEPSSVPELGKGMAECGSRTLAGRVGGGLVGQKKNSDLTYFCCKLACGSVPNASAVAVQCFACETVLQISRKVVCSCNA
jgi:hypothetical protein